MSEPATDAAAAAQPAAKAEPADVKTENGAATTGGTRDSTAPSAAGVLPPITKW